MRLLLDTHVFLWWLTGNPRIPTSVRLAIVEEGNAKLISAASAWEITTKHRTGKLTEADEFVSNIKEAIAGEGFEELPITVGDAALAGSLPGPHRDPFDRMLIAQAQAHDLVLISGEALFDRYGVRRLW